MKKRDRIKQKKFVLENKCQGCVDCCNWVTFTLSGNVSRELIEYYKARGFKIMLSSTGQVAVMIYTPCPQLSKDPNNPGCSIYKDRPALCAAYVGYNDPYLKDFCILKKGNFDIRGGLPHGSKTKNKPAINDTKPRTTVRKDTRDKLCDTEIFRKRTPETDKI